jgi:hypothetical protein
MSSVAFIAATQPSFSVTNSQSTAQQTLVTAQTRPATNANSSVTISSSALYANYEQSIAEQTVGQNESIANALANPISSQAAQDAYNLCP